MEFESQGLEFKRQVENFKEISKTGCAFANAFGGKILIGVANDGKTVGVPDDQIESIQQRCEGAIQQIQPNPLHKITIDKKDNKNIVSVEIYPIGNGAFCTFGGIVYYRAGSQNTKLEGRTLQDYLVKRQILFFDERVSEAKLKDLDSEKVKAFIQRRSPKVDEKEKDWKDHLHNLGASKQNGETEIKNVGVLFFASDPARFIPQNEIRLVRFKGTDPVDILDSTFLNGTIPEMLKEAESFIKKNTKTPLKIEKLEREEGAEYPPAVIREALVNAVCHRDYFSRDAIQINVFDDRIEFTNPGNLPNGLTLDELGRLSVLRNPLIYKLLRDIGLIEGLATGIPRIRSTLKQAGFPKPGFEELGSFFRVIIYNKEWLDFSEIKERQKRALAYLEKNSALTSITYQKLARVSHPSAVSDLNDMVKRGLLRKVGKTRGAFYTLRKNRGQGSLEDYK